jgi:hypothetical protein
MFAVRTAENPPSENPVISLNGSQILATEKNSEEGPTWQEFGPVSLDTGTHTLEASNDGWTAFDQVVIYSLQEGEQDASLEQLFDSPQTIKIEYTENNPCKYIAHVEAEAPFWLIFNETYHPLWRAYIGNQEIEPMIAYSFLNGFLIERTGAFDVEIRFLGQRYVNTCIAVSAATCVALSLCFIYPALKRRRSKQI